MYGTITPEGFGSLLGAYAAWFQARSYLTFQWRVVGGRDRGRCLMWGVDVRDDHTLGAGVQGA